MNLNKKLKACIPGALISVAIGGAVYLLASVAFVATLPVSLGAGVGAAATAGIVYAISHVIADCNSTNINQEIHEEKSKGNNIQHIPEKDIDIALIQQQVLEQGAVLVAISAELRANKAELDEHKMQVAAEQKLRDMELLELTTRLHPPGYSQLASKHGVFATSQAASSSAANDEASNTSTSSNNVRVRGVRRS